MAMEEDLVARLAAATAISAIQGNRASWFERPRSGGLPATVLTKVSPGRDYLLEGAADGLDGPRVQFDFYAETDPAAAALARATLAEMEQPATAGGTIFHAATLESELWLPPEDMDGGGKAYRVMMEFQIYHQPAS